MDNRQVIRIAELVSRSSVGGCSFGGTIAFECEYRVAVRLQMRHEANAAFGRFALPVPVMPQQPGILGDILAPEQPAPGSAYAPEGAYAPEQSQPQPIAPPVVPFDQPPVQSNDPGQFQIPPQQ